MAIGCPSCRHDDVELDKARKLAQQQADATGEAYAIYTEQGDYKIIKADTAIEQGFPIIQVLQ